MSSALPLSRRHPTADLAAIPSGEREGRALAGHLQALIEALGSFATARLDVAWEFSLGGGFESSVPVLSRARGPLESADATGIATDIGRWFQTAHPEPRGILRFEGMTWGEGPPIQHHAVLSSGDVDPRLDDLEAGAPVEPEEPGVTVWVDADAMPRALREVLFRAAERRGTPVVLVANITLPVPRGGLIRSVQVAQGPDVADDWIAEAARAGDLVITQDIPLAARVVPAGASVIQTSGRELDQESIDEALALRDLKETLREGGEMTGGPPPFGNKQKQRFANALDRWLTRNA